MVLSDAILILQTDQYHGTNFLWMIPADLEQHLAPGNLRLSGKTLFLTYPRCDMTPQDALEAVKSKLQTHSPTWTVVAREKHEDGANHLHMCIRLSKRWTSRRSDALDMITGQHGNYRVAKVVKAVLKYITKEDDWVADGIDVKAYLAPKKRKRKVSDSVAGMITEGKSIMEINREMPGYVMINMRKIQEYQSWIAIKRRRAALIPWTPLQIDLGMSISDIAISTWLNNNIMDRERPFSKTQLFIHGPTEHGKTTLIINLRRRLSIYDVPLDEQFYDYFDNDSYDLAIIDEFKGQKTIQWMNRFLDGSPMTLRKKGAQLLKTHNIPTIILSNYSPRECYPNVDELRFATIARRLHVVELSSPINVLYD